MKALTVTMEDYLELLKKKSFEPEFKPNPYDLLKFEELPDVNLIDDNWVKIKVKMGGICGSDLNFLSFKMSTTLSSFTSFPLVLGHELVGTVIERGKNVNNISVGDTVTIDENLGCKTRGIEPCSACNEGNHSLCSHMDKGNVSPGLMMGFCMDTGGAWGEYVVAHESQVFKIPENVSTEEALIAEPLACAIHGVLKKLPKDSDNCVVVGCGTMGLVTIAALKALSNCNVIAIAKYPFQSEMAKQVGADEVHVIKKDLHLKKIARKLGSRLLSPPMEISYPVGGGADVIFDSVGNASSITDALRLVKSKGTVVLIGYPSYIETNWAPIIAKEITVIGTNVFGHDTINGERKPTLQIALDLIASGKVNVKNFITHQFKLEDYKDALSTAKDKSNNVIKAAFIFE